MSSLSFEPLIPLALWVALALAGVALATWYGWKRPGAVTPRRWSTIMALMALGFALVMIILLNPTWVEPIAPPAGKPTLTVLIDSSASMASADLADGQTRYGRAAQIAQACVKDLSNRFDVRVAAFAGTSSLVEAHD